MKILDLLRPLWQPIINIFCLKEQCDDVTKNIETRTNKIKTGILLDVIKKEKFLSRQSQRNKQML